MTGLDRNQTPKTRPMPHNRSALVASLDIGNCTATTPRGPQTMPQQPIAVANIAN